MTHDTLVILDFGSQYAQLITRSVRDHAVYCEHLPWHASLSAIKSLQPKGLILSGGPASVYDPDAPSLSPKLLDLNIPILGICFGMQLITEALGGKVQPSRKREYGASMLNVETANPLLPPGTYQTWMSHGDRIEQPPPGFSVLASTENSPIAAIGDISRMIYGVQFHPEVKHTPRGAEIIGNFLFEVCQVHPTWTPESIVEEKVFQIRDQIGERRVLSAISGGVDSSVATALVHQAVGDQLEAVFVDTGLLRKDEPNQVNAAFQESLGAHLHVVEAADLFFNDLTSVVDPEEKRRRIGERFIRIFEEQARIIGHPPFLVQGTIYPDVVESYSLDRAETDTIKTHHNVGGLPEEMDFELVEPLRYLFKDEVRKIGKTLGLPEELIWRQPFPGPGLAIRCLGEVTPTRVRRLRQADAIFREELAHADYLRVHEADPNLENPGPQQGTAQSFAVLLPVKSVGVMGDQRTYEDVIALRAVVTDDFMTADWARLPYHFLSVVSNRIVNEVQGINRVVYDITSKPPGTIEWE